MSRSIPATQPELHFSKLAMPLFPGGPPSVGAGIVATTCVSVEGIRERLRAPVLYGTSLDTGDLCFEHKFDVPPHDVGVSRPYSRAAMWSFSEALIARDGGMRIALQPTGFPPLALILKKDGSIAQQVPLDSVALGPSPFEASEWAEDSWIVGHGGRTFAIGPDGGVRWMASMRCAGVSGKGTVIGVLDSEHIVAGIDAATGAERWRRRWSSPVPRRQPREGDPLAVFPHAVFVIDRSRRSMTEPIGVISLDPESGAIAWTRRVDHEVTGLVSAAHATVLMLHRTTGENEIVRLDRSGTVFGEEQLIHPVRGKAYARPVLAALDHTRLLWVAPVPLAGRSYVGADLVCGMLADVGREDWRISLPGVPSGVASRGYGSGTVTSARIVVDPDSGIVVWIQSHLLHYRT